MNDIAAQLTALQSDGLHVTVQELLRYQQYAQLLDLTPKVTPQAKMAGAYITRYKGRGMEFDEARHYQPGDDIRAIDWRVTARTGKTHTKVYREERERPVFVLCDLSHTMQFGTQLLLKAVQACHLTALIAWAAAQRGDKVGALLFNDLQHRECRPHTRKRAVFSICHELIAMQKPELFNTPPSADASYFSDACARLRRVARPGSLVYLISDFTQLDDIAQQHLVQLSRHCEIKGFAIHDAIERELPKMKITQAVTLTDGIERQTLTLGDQQVANKYATASEQQAALIAKRFSLFKASLQYIDAGKPLSDQLLSLKGAM